MYWSTSLIWYKNIPLSSLMLISGFKSLVGISNSFSTSFILFYFVLRIKKWLFSFFCYHQPYQADLWRFFNLAKYSLFTVIFSTYLISYTFPYIIRNKIPVSWSLSRNISSLNFYSYKLTGAVLVWKWEILKLED